MRPHSSEHIVSELPVACAVASPISEAEQAGFTHSEAELQTLGQTLEQRLPTTVSRRSLFYFGGAIMAATLASKVETQIMDHHYGVSGTEIIIPGSCDVAQPVANAGLASPGWGGTNGDHIVGHLQQEDIYEPSFPCGYYRFSNHSVTIDNVSSSGKNFAAKLRPQELDIHGISEGTMIALTGALAAKRHLRLITSNDSPFDINDTQHATFAKATALANELGIYHGGLLGKFAARWMGLIDTNGIHALFDGAGQSWDDTWQGADPRMLVSQLTFMKESRLHAKRQLFKGLITPDTSVVILKTEHTDTDVVVKDNQATAKWQEFYDYFGAPVAVVEVPTPGHAEVKAGIIAGAPQMRRVIYNR